VIYLFTGTDIAKARAKAFQWVLAVRTKEPEAPYLRLSADQVSASALADAAGAQGLFFKKALVLLDDPFELAAAGEAVMDALPMLAESANPVAILAPKLLPARAKKLEAVAEKVFASDLKEKPAQRGFNTALVNALAAKDGPALWKELVKAERAGDPPEALHGLLHWKARDLMQKGGGKWEKPEARSLSLALIELLSDARGGELPLKESLERFALSLR